MDSSSNVNISYSMVESRRFGLNVYRGVLPHIDTAIIFERIFQERIDLLILRIPSENKHEIASLDKLGFPYLVADTLVYYSSDLTQYHPNKLRNKDLTFKEATIGDSDLLNDMVSEIFKDYKNHYFSNPYFQKTDILEGYKEWTISYIKDESNVKTVWIGYRKEKPVCFATCAYAKEEGEGVLYGILPEAQGGGVYGDLIRFTQNDMRKKGLKTMKVSTQVHNFAVQKVWSREGFFLSESFDSIHINSFMNTSKLPQMDVPIRITDEVLYEYVKTSDAVSSFCPDKKTLDKPVNNKVPVPYACLLNIIITCFNTEFPEFEMSLLNIRYQSLKTIYPEKDYTAAIRFPVVHEDGYLKSLVTITDAREDLCSFFYVDFLHHKQDKPTGPYQTSITR